MTDLSKVTFRDAVADDAPALRALHTAAFDRDTEAALVEELVAADAVRLSMVAVLDGRIIAHVLFSPIEIERKGVRKDEGVLGLGPMAVHPDHQRQQVGFELLWAALSKLGQDGVPGVIVLGHRSYYPRFGFVPAAVHGLRWAHPCPAENFLALEMEKGALGTTDGVVHYRPEFTSDG